MYAPHELQKCFTSRSESMQYGMRQQPNQHLEKNNIQAIRINLNITFDLLSIRTRIHNREMQKYVRYLIFPIRFAFAC